MNNKDLNKINELVRHWENLIGLYQRLDKSESIGINWTTTGRDSVMISRIQLPEFWTKQLKVLANKLVSVEEDLAKYDVFLSEEDIKDRHMDFGMHFNGDNYLDWNTNSVK